MSNSINTARRAELIRLVENALNALPKYLQASLPSNISFIAADLAHRIDFMTQGRVTDFLRPTGPIAEFRRSPEFRELVSLLVGDRFLLSVIIGLPEEEQPTPVQSQIFELGVEENILRALFAIRYREGDSTQSDLIHQFAVFLENPNVRRTFTLPLYHLELSAESFDLQEFGRLTTSTARVPSIPEAVTPYILRAKAAIVTDFETHKFSVDDFSIVADDIVKRICLLRLVAGPLVSYNECFITHVEPWERRFSNHELFSRNWSHGGRALKGKAETLNQAQCEKLKSLFKNLTRINWKKMTPWRIAVNRLDEAIFKLETGSADAFLDIVIGLESLMVESDSRQESTHKVAVRTARYLESSLPLRKERFRAVKKLYGLRSKLAHGKSLILDEQNVNLICDGARILCRVLGKMLENAVTEIDANYVDLS